MSRVVALVCWTVAAGCWLVSLFLPWTAHGALSTASLIDAVGLIRGGSVDAVVPAAAAPALIAPAAAGIVLIGVVGLEGRVVGALRLVVGVVGAVVSIALAVALTDLDPGAAGAGAWVGVVGALAAAAAVAVTAIRRLGGFETAAAG